jgi:hypothetical protein
VTPDFGEAKPSPVDSRVQAAHARARLIVLAFAASIVLYIAIGIFNIRTRPPHAVTTDLPYSVYVAAIFLALGSISYRRAQMRRLRLEAVAGLRGVDGLIRHFFQVTLVSAVLAEAIGILAVVISLLGGEQSDCIRLGVVAFVVEIFTYPRRRAWSQAIAYFAASSPDH